MQQVLKAYAAGAGIRCGGSGDYGHLPDARVIQNRFRKALLDSQVQRLSKEELEQYTLMLKEQAYPFEEKGRSSCHEIKTRGVRASVSTTMGQAKASQAPRQSCTPRCGGALCQVEKGEGVNQMLRALGISAACIVGWPPSLWLVVRLLTLVRRRRRQVPRR